MINHLLSIAILAFISAVSLSTLSAQVKSESNKVVIIEKEVDENGKVTERRIVKEGAEAEAYMEQMKAEHKNTWTSEEGEDQGIRKKKVKVITEEAYEIKVEDRDGQLKVFEWDGEGEMPDEMKLLMEEHGVAEDLEKGVKHSRVRVKKKNGDHVEVMDFDFDGEDLPDEVKQQLQEEGIDLQEIINSDGTVELRVTAKGDDEGAMKAKAKKKALLGVNIENHDKGVKVSEVRAASAAAEAGLNAGDIITAIDGEAISDPAGLVQKIETYLPADKINITFLRDGRELSKEAILKEKVDLFPFKTWEQVMNNDSRTIEIEIEKEVIKEKK